MNGEKGLMISYKHWKQLNENFGLSYNLGIGQKSKVGDLHNRWDEMGLLPMKSKKMGDNLGADMGGDMGDDMGGDMPMPPKKKKKPLMGNMPAPEDDEDLGDEDDEDLGDEDEEGFDDEESGDEDEEGFDDEESGDIPPEDDMMGDKPSMPPFKKKKPPMMPPAMGMDSKMMKKESKSNCDCCKACKKGKNCSCKSCKDHLSEEDMQFMQALKDMTGGTRFYCDEYGQWVPVQEDTIIPPVDPNAQLIDDDEPGPGEVDYAPQGKLGSIGSYSEWVSKQNKKKKKINESSNGKPKKQAKKQPNKSWFGS